MWRLWLETEDLGEVLVGDGDLGILADRTDLVYFLKMRGNQEEQFKQREARDWTKAARSIKNDRPDCGVWEAWRGSLVPRTIRTDRFDMFNPWMLDERRHVWPWV